MKSVTKACKTKQMFFQLFCVMKEVWLETDSSGMFVNSVFD